MSKKNNHIFIFFILLVLISIGGLLFYRVNNINSTQVQVTQVAGKMISENYYEYSDENLIDATKNGKAVLFFATNWCSTCTELDRELKDESSKLDEGITILKIDFDKPTELKKKHNVLVQHTLVQVDEEGNAIAKWVGGDIEQINKEVK